MNKAFLKWAGGKSKSLDLILSSIGDVKGRLIEPFFGSGVITLNSDANGFIISDNNKDLINTYKAIKDDPDFVKKLSYYFSGDFNNEESFYELRDKFNESNSVEEKSFLFIYLNRYCFNGLCRYNGSGKFNVPFGKSRKVYFPEKEILNFKSKLALCDIIHCDFEQAFLLAKEDDVIYNDPPYASLAKSITFTDYSTGGFTTSQQILLAKLAEKRICKVLISNHDTEFTRELYKNADEIKVTSVNRNISALSKGRSAVNELLAIYNK